MASSGFEPGERLSSGGYRYPDHYTIQLHLGYYQSYDLSVADDFGYVCLDKGKRKLVNVVDGFQAQRRDKSRATLQAMMEMAHSLLYPCAGD